MYYRHMIKIRGNRYLLNFLIPAILFAILSIIISSQSKVSAATCTWTGNVNNEWATSGNWDGCTVPTDWDDLVFPFPNDGEVYSTVNDLPVNININGITIGWDSYEFSGNDINLRGDFMFDDDDDSGTLEWPINITIVFDYLNLRVYDEHTYVNFTGDISGGEDLYKHGSGTLILSGDNTFSGSTTVEFGRLRLASSTALQNTAVTAYNEKTIELEGDITINTTSLSLDGGGWEYGVTGAMRNISGDNTWASDIDLPFGSTWFNVEAGSLTLSGVISGTSEIHKSGSGILWFTGSQGNTYEGDTYIEDGVLRLNKSSGLAIVSNLITIGDGDGGTESAWLQGYQDDQFNSNAIIDIYSDGILAFESDWQTNNISSLNLYSGGRANLVGSTVITDDLYIEGGSLRAYFGNVGISAPNIYCTDDGGIGEITGDELTLLGEVEFSSAPGPADRCNVNNILQGSENITISGNGIAFHGVNTFTGLVTILNGARLVAANSAALGDSSTGTVVNQGGVLSLSSNVNITSEPLTISGSGNNFNGALSSQSDSNTYGGPITIQGSDNILISILGDSILTITGAISGTADQNLIFQRFNPGSGYIQLGAANNFNVAAVLLGDVTLRKNASVNIIPDTIGMHINQYSSFDLNSFSETLGALSGDAGSTISLGNAILTVGANNSDQTFSGVISGNGSITKVGTGIQTFAGNNNYTGSTNINAGKLIVNGQQPSSTVNLGTTGFLGGTGRVGVIVGGGTGGITPGNSPGILNVTGNVAFANTNSFNVELNGTTVGSQYDQLNVDGSINLNNATLNVTLGFSPTSGNTFTIVQSSSVLIGTFNGLPNGSTFTVGGNTLRIDYGTNSVVISVSSGGGGNGSGGSNGNGGGLLADTGVSIPLIALTFLVSTTAVVVFANKYAHKRRRLKKNFR